MPDTPLDRLARAADRSDTVSTVAALLRTEWDAAAEFSAPDGERTAASYARALLGVLAAGGRQSELVGYLRRAEEAALGEARSDGGFRWALAERIVSAAIGPPLEEGESDEQAV